MKRTLVFFFCLILVESSLACINEYRTLLNGEVMYTDAARGKVWPNQLDRSVLRYEADTLLSSYKRTGNLEHYSDYGAKLTYLGAYQKAKKVYTEIEILKPNSYTTASNLGTIYELIGKPDSALIWIQKSIKLNPDSHKGSEWIHIKILEFKISGSKDYNKSLLGLYFGEKGIPSNPKNYDLQKLKDHIWHQLAERTVFVKPENKIVGRIYFDLGNVIAQTTDVQAALQSYEAAKEYGFTSKLMEFRIKTLKKLARKAESFLRRTPAPIFWLSIGCLAGIIALARFRLKKQKTRFHLAKVLQLGHGELIAIEINNYLNKKSNYGRKMQKLKPSQRLLLFIQNLEREINNGGFNQFYFNSSGNFSMETAEALKTIGAYKTADIVKKANNEFPKGIVPKDLVARQTELFNIEEGAQKTWDECDTAYYLYEEDPTELLKAFVLENKADFEK